MFFNYKSDFLKIILGWQDKISGSKQLMRPQPCVTGVNCQEKSMLEEKLEQIRIFFVWFVKSTQTSQNPMVS